MDEPVGGPSTRGWSRRRRWVMAGIAVLLAAGLTTAWAAQRWSNSTTPLDLDEVVAGVDASAPESPASAVSTAPPRSTVSVVSQGPTTTTAPPVASVSAGAPAVMA